VKTSPARWALVLLVTGGLGAACSASDDREQASASSTSASTSQGGVAWSSSPTDAAGPTSSSPAPTSLPASAGSSAAAAVAELPEGPGSGPVTITYDGLGQADSTFVGQCSHDGPATTLSGTAGSATVDLVFDPSSVTLTVTDVGLGTSEAALTRLDLTVVDGRLTLTAPLVSAEQAIGSVSMDVTCGT
jgi:hypothetical protein